MVRSILRFADDFHQIVHEQDPAILQVDAHGFLSFVGQPICLMEFFHNSRLPDKPYGFSGNNYSNQQGPQLAKFFTGM